MSVKYTNKTNNKNQHQPVISHIRTRLHEKKHLHFNSDVLLFILYGSIKICGISCGAKDINLNQGTTAYLPQGQILTETASENCDFFVAQLKRDRILRFLENHSEEVAKRYFGRDIACDPILICDSSVLIREAFMSLLLLDRFDHPAQLTQMKIEELLLLLLCSNVGGQLVSLLRRNSFSRGERLRFFMEQRFLEDWGLEEYASYFGMGLTGFKTLFTDIFGVSPRAWINERRLLYAHHLLITTDLPVLHVAIESGFSSQSYFTQAYGRRFHVSPIKTRKNNKTVTEKNKALFKKNRTR